MVPEVAGSNPVAHPSTKRPFSAACAERLFRVSRRLWQIRQLLSSPRGGIVPARGAPRSALHLIPRSPTTITRRTVVPLVAALALAGTRAGAARRRRAARGTPAAAVRPPAARFHLPHPRAARPQHRPGGDGRARDEPGTAPHRPITVYLGMGTAGVMKTADNGVSWSAVFENEKVAAVGDLAISPSDPTRYGWTRARRTTATGSAGAGECTAPRTAAEAGARPGWRARAPSPAWSRMKVANPASRAARHASTGRRTAGHPRVTPSGMGWTSKRNPAPRRGSRSASKYLAERCAMSVPPYRYARGISSRAPRYPAASSGGRWWTRSARGARTAPTLYGTPG